MAEEWERYRNRYGARPETFDAYVDVWTRVPEAQQQFSSWSGFSRAANAEPAIADSHPDQVADAQRIMRAGGYEVGEPTHRGARQWRRVTDPAPPDEPPLVSAERAQPSGAAKPSGAPSDDGPRIVVFGATGFTGRLTTAALVQRGARPVIAGRHGGRLAEVADEHGGLEVAIADVKDPASVRRLVGEGDVLVTTVGPFTMLGQVALDAAIGAGAHYLDSTGEAGFIRHVFEHASPRAEASGSALLTAFGYDFVPGHLAAALAGDAAGDGEVTELRILYSGLGTGLSSGTRASAQVILTEPTHRLSDGRLVHRPVGRDVSLVSLGGRRHHVLLAGGTEPLALGHRFPGVESVSVWLDVGPVAWLAKATSYPLPLVLSIPMVRNLTRRTIRTTGAGPDDRARAASTSRVTAIALDRDGDEIARAEVRGPNPYDLTATTLAAGAIDLAHNGPSRAGALGPLDLFTDLDLSALLVHLGLSTT